MKAVVRTTVCSYCGRDVATERDVATDWLVGVCHNCGAWHAFYPLPLHPEAWVREDGGGI